MGRLFGTNGIRGLANVELTPEFVSKIGGAVGSFFDGGELIVGNDGRITSPMLVSALTSGLVSVGCKVQNAGLAPTPTIQYTVRKLGVDGGVIITASHNPPQYNGIKVLGEDGVEISRDEEDEIEEIFFEGKFKRADWDKVGKVSRLEGIFDEYMEGLKKHLDVESIREAEFRVVVDPANGVGALATPRFLQHLGCHVITINAEVDGRFPGRPPEPRPDNLVDLAKTVNYLNADLGVALDGDADRAIFVDEKGKIHWGDRTFALIAKFFLKENPGSTIVTPISSSSLIKDVVEAGGGKIVHTKVGSVEVSHKMKEINAELGGEENGGVFYGPHIPVRDGTMTTGLILNILMKSKRKLSQLLSELPMYYLEKVKAECPNDLKKEVMKKMATHFEGLPTISIDGIKAFLPNGKAILVRPSGTEPAIRIYAQGRSKEDTREIVEKYFSILTEVIENVKGGL